MSENTNMTRCDCCHELHDPSDMTTVKNGYAICPDCLEESYYLCDHCHEYEHIDACLTINPGTNGVATWCTECAENYATTCDDCGGLFSDWFIRSDEHRSICDTCFEQRWYRCTDCREFVHVDDVQEFDGDYYCPDCASTHGAIRNYSYKPAPSFAYRGRENPDAALTFGVELEVDDGDDCHGTAKAVVDASNGRLYCKHDGSLDEGFEIVSHPASLAFHLYEFRWAAIMRLCLKAGFRSHDTDTCGLHIHVGRAQLGQTQEACNQAVANLVLLTQRLGGDLTTFSRRKPSQLARWAALPALNMIGYDGQPYNDATLTSAALNLRFNGRYQAVNQENEATVEFRIFRGTLNRDTLAASLELVNNMCQYAMTHTPTQCLSATFADIVRVDPRRELVAYSTSRGLIATSISIPA